MRKLWLFRAGGNPEQILHEVSEDGSYKIVNVLDLEEGVDGRHLPPSEDILAQARQDNAACFVIGDERLLNQSRLAAYMAVKAGGMNIISLRSETSSVAESVKLRENVWVDHATRILSGARIGANTWIMRNSELGANCKVGSSCWIGPNCQVSERATLGKNCTLGPGTIIGPDVVLPEWSRIGGNVTLTQSPSTTLFIDSRFRAPVHFFY